jgi:hypothetical protein
VLVVKRLIGLLRSGLGKQSMNIAASKQLRRDICRTVGHVWESFSRAFPGYSEGGNICSRCKRREKVWGMGQPTFVGTMPPRVDVPVGEVLYDPCSGYMIINDGVSWRTMGNS